MKKFIILLLVLSIALPVFAGKEVTDIKARKSSLLSGYVCICIGVWGILSHASTGGAYSLVTGTLFVYTSFLHLKEAVELSEEIKSGESDK